MVDTTVSASPLQCRPAKRGRRKSRPIS